MIEDNNCVHTPRTICVHYKTELNNNLVVTLQGQILELAESDTFITLRWLVYLSYE